MILSAESIKAALQKGELAISPFHEENLKPASYSFTLSERLLAPIPVALIKVGTELQREEVVIGAEGFVLKPGGFVLGCTKERVSLRGNYVCLLGTRGSCAQLGMNVLLGSIIMEPDTDNCIVLEIHNASNSPIRLEEGMKLVKGIFMRVE
jgi:dCTP deaminase